MSFFTALPSKVLAPYVRKYWGVESRIDPGSEHVQRIVPSGLAELIFFPGDKPVSSDSKRDFAYNSLINGQQNGYYDLKIRSHLTVYSIIFQPYSLPVFFNIPSREFFNNSVPLQHILKNEVNELEGRLGEASNMKERVAVTEEFLIARLRRHDEDYQFKRVAESIALINRKRGMVNIEELSSLACLSQKQFTRIFSEHVGASPKQFLRIVRFQNALERKSMKAAGSLTELCYLCGYYDQSHMTAEFRHFSGMSPREYFSSCEPYSDYFQ